MLNLPDGTAMRCCHCLLGDIYHVAEQDAGQCSLSVRGPLKVADLALVGAAAFNRVGDSGGTPADLSSDIFVTCEFCSQACLWFVQQPRQHTWKTLFLEYWLKHGHKV